MAQISEPSFLFLGTLWNEAFQRSLGGTGHLPDILIRHPPPEGPPAGPGSLASANLGPTPFWSVYRALGAESQKGLRGALETRCLVAPVPMQGLTGFPKPGKSPKERARAVSLLVAPALLSMPSPLGWVHLAGQAGSAREVPRGFGEPGPQELPPGLASAPSRVGEGSRVDPCPLRRFTCDLSVAGRDTQLVRLACV